MSADANMTELLISIFKILSASVTGDPSFYFTVYEIYMRPYILVV